MLPLQNSNICFSLSKHKDKDRDKERETPGRMKITQQTVFVCDLKDITGHPGIVVDNTAASFGSPCAEPNSRAFFFFIFFCCSLHFSVILTQQSPFGAVALILIISKLFSWSDPSS